MKLLVVLSRFPYPLEKGDQLRAYHQIKALSALYELHLFCLSPNPVPAAHLQALTPYCASICIGTTGGWLSRLFQVFRFWCKGWPLQCAYFFSRRAKRRFDAYYAQVSPDLLLGQLLRTMPYTADKSVFKVLDYLDVLSYGMYKRYQVARGLRRWLFRYEYGALSRAETQAFSQYDLCTIISEQDRDALPLDHTQQMQVKVWRNGVDTDYFKPVPPPTDRVFDIVFAGNMGYQPNEDAAEYLVQHLQPAMAQRDCPVDILLAGTSPTYVVRRLASDTVTVTGWIRDMREAYASGKMLVAPMRLGTGMQNKLLEAMACELPCIASEIAVRGLGDFDDCPVCAVPLSFDNDRVPGALVEAVSRYLADAGLRAEAGRRGRAFVLKYYSWPAQAVHFKTWTDGFVLSGSHVG